MAKKISAEDIYDVGTFTALLKTLEKVEDKIKNIISVTSKKIDSPATDYEGYKKQVEAINDVKKGVEQLTIIEKEKLQLEAQLKKANSDKIQQNEELKILLAEQRKINKQMATDALAEQGLIEKKTKATKEQKVATEQLTEAERKQVEISAKRRIEGQAIRESTRGQIADEKFLKQSFDLSTMSLGELNRALRGLRNVSFVGKSPEEINHVKKMIGELTDKVRDLRAETNAYSMKAVEAMVGGLKFVSAGVEGVVASLELMGVEGEQIKHIKTKLVALIAATQALAEIEKTLSERKLQAYWIKIKDVVISAKETVVKWLNVAATNAQVRAEANKAVVMGKANILTKAVTAVQWAWNAAVAANPIVAFSVAVGALVVGIGALIYALSSSEKAMTKAEARGKMYKDTIKDINEGVATEITNTKILVNAISDTTLSEGKRNEKLKELNKTLEEKGLKTVKDINDTKGLKDATNALNEVLIASIKIEAYRSKLKDLYLKQIEQEQKQSAVLFQLEKYRQVGGNAVEFDKWAGKLPKWIRDMSGIVSGQGNLTEAWLDGTKISKDLTTQINVYLEAISKQNTIIPVTTEKIEKQNEATQMQIKIFKISFKQMQDLEAWMEDQRIKNLKSSREKELAEWNNTYMEKFDVAYENEYLLADLKELNRKNIDAINKKWDDKEFENLKDSHKKSMDEYQSWANSWVKHRQEYLADEAERLKKEQEIREKEISAIEDYAKKVQEKRQRAMDREIDNSKRHQDLLREMAARGSEDAKNNLAFEEANQRKLELQKEKALQRAKRVEMGMVVLKAYSKNIESSNGNSTEALNKTIKDATILTAFIRALPAFYEGTENTGKGGNVDDKGGFHAILHPEERVMTAEQNKQLAGITNWELVNAGTLYKKGIDSVQNNTWQTNEQILKKFDELKETINNKPSLTGTEYDGVTNSIITIIENGNSIKRNHKTLSKLG